VNAAPPDAAAWDAGIAAYHRDLEQLQSLLNDRKRDLFGNVPAGSGQTFLREFCSWRIIRRITSGSS